MSDQEKKEETTNVTPQPDAENKKTELTEEELKKATGGTPSGQPVEYLKINMTEVH